MSLGGRAVGHLDDAPFGTPAHLSQGGTGIGANIVADDILYAIPDVRLDDIGYGSRTDSIAAGKLGMGKPRPLFFVQIKQYLATLQYGFTILFITDCFLKCSPFIVTGFLSKFSFSIIFSLYFRKSVCIFLLFLPL